MAELRHFKCDYYEIDAPANSCLFCEHCHDVFYDWNGPYAFGCNLTSIETEDGVMQKVFFGLQEGCPNFKEEEQ